MYYFYRQDKECIIEDELPNGVKIVKSYPHAFIKGMSKMQIGKKRLLYFSIMSFFCKGFKRVFVEYNMIKEKKIISKAVCCSKVPIYEFMPMNGVHLGYAETLEKERGKGCYPILLNYIQRDFPQKNLYMIVAENNLSSIRGIEKAGFKRYAIGKKNENGHFVVSDIILKQ